MSKGCGRRRPQVSGSEFDSNWNAIFGKKDQSLDIECEVVDQEPTRSDVPLKGSDAIESFKALEGMGGCIVEGNVISSVCRYIHELEAKVHEK